jgi:hypothetical protein
MARIEFGSVLAERFSLSVAAQPCVALLRRAKASYIRVFRFGAVAHLGERLVCIQEVEGSIPFGSTFTPACQ